MTYYVNVYDEDQQIIAKVEYNNNLDILDGNNNYCRGVGRHLGITKIANGRYVLIHGTQWQGERDYAEVISNEQAIQEILEGNPSLLNEAKFAELKELAENTLIKEV